MSNQLEGKSVAILATDGFEQAELFGPKEILENAGAQISIISNHPGEIKGWNHDQWGQSIGVDATIEEVNAEQFDSLVLPGGVMNPDKLRMNEAAVGFIRDFFEQGKPVGAICHAPWLLAEADVVEDRKVTSWPSIRTDLENAGANWVDREVVVDGGLVTSRKPDDIPAFGRKLIEEISEGIHEQQEEAVR
ncbi:MAG TPA: type 1 glutamine amidotransferase domain-containing protein [Fimbriimonadaceae bacterium]|jgi:protease I